LHDDGLTLKNAAARDAAAALMPDGDGKGKGKKAALLQ
jgi:hypothetical protein